LNCNQEEIEKYLSSIKNYFRNSSIEELSAETCLYDNTQNIVPSLEEQLVGDLIFRIIRKGKLVPRN
jgi:hypothetical protein